MRANLQTISQVARAAGVGVQTVRFYERERIFPEPKRNGAGYRLFSEETVARLRFVKRAQGLGFSLEEIRELLALPRADCGQVRKRAERKRGELDGKITELRRLRRALDKLIAECAGEGPVSRCTILSSLEENS